MKCQLEQIENTEIQISLDWHRNHRLQQIKADYRTESKERLETELDQSVAALACLILVCRPSTQPMLRLNGLFTIHNTRKPAIPLTDLAYAGALGTYDTIRYDRREFNVDSKAEYTGNYRVRDLEHRRIYHWATWSMPPPLNCPKMQLYRSFPSRNSLKLLLPDVRF